MRNIPVYIILFILLVIPVIITIMNIINLFKKKAAAPYIFDALTMTLGPLFSVLFFGVIGAKDFQEPIVPGAGLLDKHTPIASWHLPTILVLAAIAIIGFFVLRFAGKKAPPVVAVLCLSSVFMGFALSICFIVQLLSDILNLGFVYAALFPLNYILCSVRLIKNTIRYQVGNMNENDHTYDKPILNQCKAVLSHSISWIIVPFILMLPLLGILMVILMLFGQKPDAVIKAFTETSDWTLSQKISPPPLEQDAHYLCTVALRGDERLVKPTRLGIRHGRKIVVNRQLCVANAFEQYIQEKMPRIHSGIRRFYDKYGYPLSKHITTSGRANIVYLLMKPLEWFFVVFLYTVDKRPENRISMQYITRQ